MMQFAFAGKYDMGTEKHGVALSKIKSHAMHDLYQKIAVEVLPSFSSVASDESMVDKLQKFLSDLAPSAPASAASASASTPSARAKTSTASAAS